MALKEIAVDGMDFDFVSGSDSGDLELVGDPSLKVKAEGLGVYNSSLVVKVENFENANVIDGTGAGPFLSTSKAKNLLPSLRVGDIAVMVGTGTNKTPPPVVLPFSSAVEITDANQIKAKG